MVPSKMAPEKSVAAWPRFDDNSYCILRMTTDDYQSYRGMIDRLGPCSFIAMRWLILSPGYNQKRPPDKKANHRYQNN
jgi:hypothetical protein